MSNSEIDRARNNIPEDVLIDILVMLPVKSLMRFICVNKYWYALIHSSSFIYNHYKRYPNSTLVVHRYDKNTICRFRFTHSEFATMFPPNTTIINTIETYNLIFPWHAITRPVDGLFLLHNGCEYGDYYNKLAVWNPATTELRILPLPNSHFLKNLGEYAFAFGFDNLTNDYKVIWFTCRSFCREIPDPPDVALYSLGTNTWRIFNAFLPYVSKIYRRESAYLNGVYYWVSISLNNSKYVKESRLVAFDFSTEVFREIKIPNSSISRLDTHEQYHKLALHNDESVALLVYRTARVLEKDVYFGAIDTIDMWVMMNDNGCWSKSKLFTLRLDSSLHLAMPIVFCKSNDEIFFITEDDELVLYNIDSGKLHHFGIRCDNIAHHHFSYSIPISKYKESLVSFGGQKNCKLNGVFQVVQLEVV